MHTQVLCEKTLDEKAIQTHLTLPSIPSGFPPFYTVCGGLILPKSYRRSELASATQQRFVAELSCSGSEHQHMISIASAAASVDVQQRS